MATLTGSDNCKKIKKAIIYMQRYSEKIIAELMRSINPTVLLSYDKNIIDINPHAEIVLKCCRKEVLGKNIAQLSAFSSDIIDGIKTRFVDKGNTSCTITWNLAPISSLDCGGVCYVLFGERNSKKFEATNGQKLFSAAVTEEVLKIVTQLGEEKYFKTHLNWMIQSLPGYAHLKDATTFKYQMSNISNANMLGFCQPEGLIGKRVHDLRNFLPSLYIKQIHDCDEETIVCKKALIGIAGRPFLDANGLAKALSLTKIPIKNESDEIIGVFTLAFDSAELRNMEILRDFYRRLCRDKKVGHRKFLQHIGMKSIQDRAEITEREFDCLLAISKFTAQKLAAASINMGSRTIETHLSKIKEKLGFHTIAQAKEYLAFLRENLQRKA